MAELPVILGEPGKPQAGLLCPVCRVALVVTGWQNIEIDYCPNCRGVWLDRGELDKIIERSLPDVAAQPATAAAQPQPDRYAQPDPYYGNDGRRSDHSGSNHGRSDQGHGHGGGHRSGHGNSGYRRKSWLRELFD